MIALTGSPAGSARQLFARIPTVQKVRALSSAFTSRPSQGGVEIPKILTHLINLPWFYERPKLGGDKALFFSRGKVRKWKLELASFE
jgi:hypothetical protein